MPDDLAIYERVVRSLRAVDVAGGQHHKRLFLLGRAALIGEYDVGAAEILLGQSAEQLLGLPYTHGVSPPSVGFASDKKPSSSITSPESSLMRTTPTVSADAMGKFVMGGISCWVFPAVAGSSCGGSSMSEARAPSVGTRQN